MQMKVPQRALAGALGALILVMLLAPAVTAAASSPRSEPAVQQFSSPLAPYNVPLVPQGYEFGSGVWAGSIDGGFTQMSYTVTLSGGMPNTGYLVRVTFYNSTGGAFARSYGLLTTDGSGYGVFASTTQIFKGTVRIGLSLWDKTNFSPPLKVLVADPRIGSDAPT